MRIKSGVLLAALAFALPAAAQQTEGQEGKQAGNVENANDVISLNADLRSRLLEESRDDLLVLRDLGEKHLDRHALAKVEVHRGDDDAHAALPENTLDAVLVPKESSRPEALGCATR